jgi:hypothetical protein
MALTEAQHQALQRVLQGLISHTNRNRRRISQRFYTFPLKDEYPDYYSRIKNARAFSSIQKALLDHRYATPKQVYEDLKLVFLQGQEYHKRSSEAYRDCDKMNAVLDDVWTGEIHLPTLEEMDVKRTRGEEEEFDESGNKKRLDRLTPQELSYMKSFGKETNHFHTTYLRQVQAGTTVDDLEVDDPITRAGSEVGNGSPMLAGSPPPLPRAEAIIWPSPPPMTLYPEETVFTIPGPNHVVDDSTPSTPQLESSRGMKLEDGTSDMEEDAPRPVASTSRTEIAPDSSSGWLQDSLLPVRSIRVASRACLMQSRIHTLSIIAFSTD